MSFSAEYHISELPAAHTDETRLYLFVGGTSESGKSGLTSSAFHQNAANRIKYLRVANELGNELYGNNDPYAFFDASQENIASNHQRFWQQLQFLLTDYHRVTFVETIKHPELVRSFGKTGLDAQLLTIFVDADFDERVTREAERVSVDPVEMRKLIEAKDAFKYQTGLEEVRQLADISVYNNGTYEEYLAWANDLFEQITTLYPNTSQNPALLYE